MPFTGDTRRPGPDTLGRTLSSWVTETAAATVNKVVGSAQKSSPLVKTALKQDRVRRDSSATIEAGVPGTPTPGATDDTGQSAKSQIIQPKTPTSSTPTFGKAAFASLFGGQKPAAIPASLDTEADELCTLDIGQFLPVPQASQQPTAAEMKMMHDNATKMLNRFQNGYRKRIGQIHDLRAEGEAKDEELEGESVRNKSLRAQLEAMSRTVLERDETLKQFMDELAAKSGIIDELNVARRAEEEDLEVEKRLAHKRETRDRHSSVSATTLSTLDTDGESLYDPVFSRTISRATTPLSPTNETTPKAARSSRASAVSVLSDDMDDSLDTIRPSGGVAAKPVAKSIRTVYKCDNCQGKDSNYAWKALGTVREEKQRLESRCHELEVATDEVLALLKIGT